MQTKKYIDVLWDQFRTAINEAYEATQQTDDGGCLRDYAENISWHDGLSALLGRESANERQHRSHRPSVPGFSVESAAKLIIMQQTARGAELVDIPRATEFLMFRQTAAEARLIGWLIRDHVTIHWREALGTLDYAELMKVQG